MLRGLKIILVCVFFFLLVVEFPSKKKIKLANTKFRANEPQLQQ